MMENPAQIFEDEFCPLLDAGLVRSILLDFAPLSDGDQQAQARDVLEALKGAALEQEVLESIEPPNVDVADSDDFEPASIPTGASSDPGAVTLSQDFSSISLGNSTQSAQTSADASYHLESRSSATDDSFDASEKAEFLQELFPKRDPAGIAQLLTDEDCDLERAIEVLLNLEFLDEDDEDEDDDMVLRSPKGIDGFAVENGYVPIHSKRLRKANQARIKRLSLQQADAEAFRRSWQPTGKADAWQAGAKIVESMASKTKLQRSLVQSMYHEAGASVPVTLRRIIQTQAPRRRILPDQLGLLNNEAARLLQDHPHLTIAQTTGLLRLTWPSTADAHELAGQLKAAPEPRGKIDIVPVYRKPVISPAASSFPSLPRSSRRQSQLQYTFDASSGDHRALAAQYYSQAAAAFRKGKSDPTQRAAAAVYAEAGQAHVAGVRRMESEEADALVKRQSPNPSTIDLHGVNVRDAVRISDEKVNQWWHALGEQRLGNRTRGSLKPEFTIITGKGLHSEGGIARIAPAVLKKLTRDGWDARGEGQSGTLVVRGVKR